MKSIKFSFINVCGLVSKLQIPEFCDFVKKYDIFCVAETKLDAFDVISLDGYIFKGVSRKHFRRKSGGVGIFVKDTLYESIDILECNNDFSIWFKFKNSNCIFGVLYIPPENSAFSSLSLFDDLENIVLNFSSQFDDCSFCIFGDLNAKTGNLNDFVHLDRYVIQDNVDDITLQDISQNSLVELGFPLEHFSKDTRNCDNYGYRLLEFCKFTGLHIVNGRCGLDAYIGKSTCSSGSVIDYVLASNINFSRIKHFDILEYDPLYSDVHCALELCFCVAGVLTDSSNDDVDTSFSFDKPIWEPTAEESFVNNLDNSALDSLLLELDGINEDTISEDVVNKITVSVANVITGAAKKCDMIKHCQVNRNRSKPKAACKPWFDSDCKSLRKEYFRSKHRYRYVKTQENYDCLINNSKRYKKEINSKLRLYNKQVVQKLKSLKACDPKSYWSLLNKYSGEKKAVIDKISNDVFHEHFSKLNDFGDVVEDDINIKDIVENNTLLNEPFTVAEVQKAIKSLKNNKASSPFDNILNEYLKFSDKKLDTIICKLFNIILDSGIFPDIWSKGVIIPLYKNKGDINDPDNYRGITILSCFGKLFTSMLNSRLNAYLEDYNLLCEEQAGFLKHHSTIDHVFSLKCLIDLYLAKNKKLFCAFIDYRKAFDSVNRTALWRKLLCHNVDGKCFKIIHNMYSKAKSCVRVNNSLSEFFASFTGVRQGENLSPILFSLFLNDINDFLSSKYNGLPLVSENVRNTLSNDDVDVYFKLFLLLYADDTVILAESSEELQFAMNAMSDYCKMWNLQVNPLKTKIVVFCKSKRGLRNMPNFNFEDSLLEIVDHFSYLGVQFSYNGKFTRTKIYVVEQARRAMFSVMKKARKLSLPVDMQLHLFDTMISPILMYGSEVWGIENIDIIDRFKLKFLN